MFGLFGKKPAAQSLEQLQAAVDKARSGKDYPELARACYRLGLHYMDQEKDTERANLWLCRASTIYGAQDEVFDAVGEKLMDDCDERIGQLEEVPTLRNQLPEKIAEQAEALEDIQIRLWGLMSLARLVPLGQKLSALPGCGALGELRRAVELLLSAFQGNPVPGGDVRWVNDLCSRIYELGDAPAFFAGGAVEVSGGAPFQVFDLNGSLTLLEIDGYLDGFNAALVGGQKAESSGEETETIPQEGQAETDLIPCTLLLDYYLRTRPDVADVTQLPQVQKELARMQDDFRFLRDWPPMEEIARRIQAYLELDILAG